MTTISRMWRDASRHRQQLAVAGCGLALLGVGCSILALWPAHARQGGLQARLAGLQRELADAQAHVGELARNRREKATLETRLGLLAERLSPTRDLPALYRTLQEAATQAGLPLVLFRPRPPKAGHHYTEIPIAVTTHGTYHRLGHFLARIAGLPSVVTIEELTITAIERHPETLRAEMILTAYVYRPLGAPDPVSSAAPGPQRAGGPQAP